MLEHLGVGTAWTARESGGHDVLQVEVTDGHCVGVAECLGSDESLGPGTETGNLAIEPREGGIAVDLVATRPSKDLGNRDDRGCPGFFDAVAVEFVGCEKSESRGVRGCDEIVDGNSVCEAQALPLVNRFCGGDALAEGGSQRSPVHVVGSPESNVSPALF